MEVKRMNDSLDNMEKIVAKMSTIKDAYELLEKNSERLDVINEKILVQQNTLTNLSNEVQDVSANNKATIDKLISENEAALCKLMDENAKIVSDVNNILTRFNNDVINELETSLENFNRKFDEKFEKEVSNFKGEIVGMVENSRKDNSFYRGELLKSQKLVKILLAINSVLLLGIVILQIYLYKS